VPAVAIHPKSAVFVAPRLKCIICVDGKFPQREVENKNGSSSQVGSLGKDGFRIE
jgi:hypothetical protein